jgi:hypothetical protein
MVDKMEKIDSKFQNKLGCQQLRQEKLRSQFEGERQKVIVVRFTFTVCVNDVWLIAGSAE